MPLALSPLFPKTLTSSSVIGVVRLATQLWSVIASGIADIAATEAMGDPIVAALTISVSKERIARCTWDTHSLIGAFAPPSSTTNRLL